MFIVHRFIPHEVGCSLADWRCLSRLARLPLGVAWASIPIREGIRIGATNACLATQNTRTLCRTLPCARAFRARKWGGCSYTYTEPIPGHTWRPHTLCHHSCVIAFTTVWCISLLPEPMLGRQLPCMAPLHDLTVACAPNRSPLTLHRLMRNVPLCICLHRDNMIIAHFVSHILISFPLSLVLVRYCRVSGKYMDDRTVYRPSRRSLLLHADA